MLAQLFGIEFSAATTVEAKLEIAKALNKNMQSLYFINAHCVNVAMENSEYRDALHQANYILPDGLGIELGCRFTHQTLSANLNGTDLFPHICQLCEILNAPVFLLGGKAGTAEQVQQWMEINYPNIEVAGCHQGYFDSQESDEIINKINHSGAKLLIVAMGVPRQELWIRDNIHRLDTSLNIAAGGLFEFYSGNIPRASERLRKYKLEWLWRLIQEPKRLFRRYVLGNVHYLIRLARCAYQQRQTERLLTSRFDFFTRFKLSLRRCYFQTIAASQHSFRAICRRSMDVIAASISLLLLLPFLPLLVLLIKLDSPGPVFFKQTRVGAAGRPFSMFKFRSMRVDAEQLLETLKGMNEKKGGVMFKMTDDPRVTRVGRFIRRYSIDELPQLWNILKGDMTLVGPRPALPTEVAQYYFHQRTRIIPKPGVTSQWVIAGRNDLTFAEQAELDAKYYLNSSLWSDIVIIVKTIPIIFTGKGAS